MGCNRIVKAANLTKSTQLNSPITKLITTTVATTAYSTVAIDISSKKVAVLLKTFWEVKLDSDSSNACSFKNVLRKLCLKSAKLGASKGRDSGQENRLAKTIFT